MGYRLVDKTRLAGFEHLLRLPKMLATVVRQKHNAIDLPDKLVYRGDYLNAHRGYLPDVGGVAVCRRKDILRTPFVCRSHPEPVAVGMFFHIDDPGEIYRMTSVKSDDPDSGLGRSARRREQTREKQPSLDFHRHPSLCSSARAYRLLHQLRGRQRLFLLTGERPRPRSHHIAFDPRAVAMTVAESDRVREIRFTSEV